MIVGTITGEAESRSIKAAPERRERTTKKASGTPKPIARAVQSAATFRLRVVESIQDGSPKYRAYHCHENPGGGNCRYDDEDTEIVKTTSSGNIRNAKTSAALAPIATRPTVKLLRRRMTWPS